MPWAAPPGHGTRPLQHHQQQQQQKQRLQRRRSGSSTPGGGRDDDPQREQKEHPRQPPPATGLQQEAAQLPTFMEGINWYCYVTLFLIFLADLTPLGRVLASSGAAAPFGFAALQWGGFVAPTLVWCRQRGFDLTRMLKLQPCSPQALLAGLLAGPAVWLVINAAIAAKTGMWHLSSEAPLPLDTGASSSAAAAWLRSASSAGADGGGGGGGGGGGAASVASAWAGLLVTGGLSPAVAEELLFRGLLLTSLQQRLGSGDAVAVAAGLFAAAHLSLEQFFPYCVLGFAAGGAVLAAGGRSVWPAVALHAGYNAAALAAGAVLISKGAAAAAAGGSP